MAGTGSNTLVNPQNGNLAFKVFYFEGKEHFDYVQRNNFYTLIIAKKCNGILKADFTSYEIAGKNVFAFSPYQPFLFSCSEDFEGVAIHFHPDFFCIHKHQNQVACNGVLFNNIYKPPFVAINDEQESFLYPIIEQMVREIPHTVIGQYELLVSHLKILLIHLSRIKIEQNPQARQDNADDEPPFILQNLKEAIETNFKSRHTASDYAGILHISPKALGKLTKKHFSKTLTELISERIVIEAKRELYQTSKTIKTIAYELGYDDEFYFSRFFKKNTDISPQLYRETVGFAAAE
jgi:AraC-like DNA-binding protein